MPLFRFNIDNLSMNFLTNNNSTIYINISSILNYSIKPNLRTMITLKLETSNAVFEGSEGFVASHIIQKCIKKLEQFDTLENDTYIIRDINGNKIGSVTTESEQ